MKMIEINSLSELERYLNGIKVLIFDLDDTLYDEIDYVKSGFLCVAQVLQNVDNVSERLYELFKQGERPIDKLLEEEGIVSEEIKTKCLKSYRTQVPNIALSDDVRDLLDLLKKSGYRLGVITDGRVEGQKAKIKALGLDHFIEKIIITDELGGIEYRKPNPKAFEMMRDFFDVKFEEMCYIGDNISKDFVAPDMLGMKSILYKNPNGLYFKVRLKC